MKFVLLLALSFASVASASSFSPSPSGGGSSGFGSGSGYGCWGDEDCNGEVCIDQHRESAGYCGDCRDLSSWGTCRNANCHWDSDYKLCHASDWKSSQEGSSSSNEGTSDWGMSDWDDWIDNQFWEDIDYNTGDTTDMSYSMDFAGSDADCGNKHYFDFRTATEHCEEDGHDEGACETILDGDSSPCEWDSVENKCNVNCENLDKTNCPHNPTCISNVLSGLYYTEQCLTFCGVVDDDACNMMDHCKWDANTTQCHMQCEYKSLDLCERDGIDGCEIWNGQCIDQAGFVEEIEECYNFYSYSSCDAIDYCQWIPPADIPDFSDFTFFRVAPLNNVDYPDLTEHYCDELTADECNGEIYHANWMCPKTCGEHGTPTEYFSYCAIDETVDSCFSEDDKDTCNTHQQCEWLLDKQRNKTECVQKLCKLHTEHCETRFQCSKQHKKNSKWILIEGEGYCQSSQCTNANCGECDNKMQCGGNSLCNWNETAARDEKKCQRDKIIDHCAAFDGGDDCESVPSDAIGGRKLCKLNATNSCVPKKCSPTTCEDCSQKQCLGGHNNTCDWEGGDGEQGECFTRPERSDEINKRKCEQDCAACTMDLCRGRCFQTKMQIGEFPHFEEMLYCANAVEMKEFGLNLCSSGKCNSDDCKNNHTNCMNSLGCHFEFDRDKASFNITRNGQCKESTEITLTTDVCDRSCSECDGQRDVCRASSECKYMHLFEHCVPTAQAAGVTVVTEASACRRSCSECDDKKELCITAYKLGPNLIGDGCFWGDNACNFIRSTTCEDDCGLCNGYKDQCGYADGCYYHEDKCMKENEEEPMEGCGNDDGDCDVDDCNLDCGRCDNDRDACEDSDSVCKYFDNDDHQFCYLKSNVAVSGGGAGTGTQASTQPTYGIVPAPQITGVCEYTADGLCEEETLKIWFSHPDATHFIYSVSNVDTNTKPTRDTDMTRVRAATGNLISLAEMAEGILIQIPGATSDSSEDPSVRVYVIAVVSNFTEAHIAMRSFKVMSQDSSMLTQAQLLKGAPTGGMFALVKVGVVIGITASRRRRLAEKVLYDPFVNGGGDFNGDAFKQAVMYALNIGNTKCEAGQEESECKTEFTAIKLEDISLSYVGVDNSVTVNLQVLKEDAYTVGSRMISNAYFKFPLGYALMLQGFEFGEVGGDPIENFNYLAIDTTNSILLEPPAADVAEAELSDGVKAAAAAGTLVVVLMLIFVVYMHRKNRQRAKVLDNREEEMNKKLALLDAENKKLNQEQSGAERERKKLQAEIEKEEASLHQKLSAEDKAKIDELANELNTLGDAKMIEEEAILDKIKKNATLSAIELTKLNTLLGGDDASVKADHQKACLVRRMADREVMRSKLVDSNSTSEVDNLDQQAAVEASLLSKLTEGEALNDEEQKIMASYEQSIHKVTTMTDAQSMTKRDALQKKLADRQMKREMLKKKKRDAEASGQVDAAVEQELVQLEQEQAGAQEAIILDKINSGKKLSDTETKEAEEAAELYEKELLKEAQATSAKIEARLADSKTNKSDALTRRIEERKRKKEMLEQQKNKIARANTMDAKKIKAIEQKKLKLGSVLSRMKKTGDKMAKNEREAKRVQEEANNVLTKVNKRVAADENDQKSKMARRKAARDKRRQKETV